MVHPGTRAPLPVWSRAWRALFESSVFESAVLKEGARGRRVVARLVSLSLGVALWVNGSDARADIYKYVDKDGVIHFSNVSKKGKMVARAKPRAPGASAPSRAPSKKTPDEYDAYIREAASLYQIPEALVRAVIRVESNFDPRVMQYYNIYRGKTET
jgi:soluble lytic murein transglycosylase-like protein